MAASKTETAKAGIDVVQSILARDAGLDREMLALKYAKMRKDDFAFLRATCHLHYARLSGLDRLRDAPAALCCGDLHLENYGSFKASDGLVYFDVNDFDESLLAPCLFDVLRACASIPAACRKAGLAAADARRLMQAFVETYARALAAGTAHWVERDRATGPAGALMEGLRGRSRKELLDSRAPPSGSGKRMLAKDGRHALPEQPGGADHVRALVAAWAESDPEARKKMPAGFFEVVDCARRVAGLGSLGLERHVALVRGSGGPDGMRLIDIKRARASCALAASGLGQPDWPGEAERIVAIAELMQARTPRWLAAGGGFVIRQLQPSEDRLDLSEMSGGKSGFATAVPVFAELTAWAHLRAAGRRGAAPPDALEGFGRQTAWRAPLLKAAAASAADSLADWKTFADARENGAFA